MQTTENRDQYLARLSALIRRRHGCQSEYRRTAEVREILRGNKRWKGHGEVFFLPDHPKAKRCYVWEMEVGSAREFKLVLESPPAVIGPATAVRAVLAQLS